MRRQPVDVLTRGVVYLLGILVCLPIAWLVVASFRPSYDLIARPFLFPDELTLANYNELLRLPSFWSNLLNSIIAAMGTTGIVMTLSLPVAYGMARFEFLGRRFLELIFLSGAYLFAPAVLVFPYFHLLLLAGLVNSTFGIIFAHTSFCLPFAIAISRLMFLSISVKLEQVAILDGASWPDRFFKIVLGGVAPQIGALSLLVFAISWKEFFYSFVLSMDDQSRTLPVLLAQVYGGESHNWGVVTALSTVLVAPAVLLLVVGRQGGMMTIVGQEGTRG